MRAVTAALLAVILVPPFAARAVAQDNPSLQDRGERLLNDLTGRGDYDRGHNTYKHDDHDTGRHHYRDDRDHDEDHSHARDYDRRHDRDYDHDDRAYGDRPHMRDHDDRFDRDYDHDRHDYNGRD